MGFESGDVVMNLLQRRCLVEFLRGSFPQWCANISIYGRRQAHALGSRSTLHYVASARARLYSCSHCAALGGGLSVSDCNTLQRRDYAKKARSSQQRLDEGEVDIIDLQGLESSMQGAVNALKYEYTNTVIARITPAVLDRVTVDVGGQSYLLKQLGQIGMPNPATLVINLASYPEAMEAAIGALRATDLNLNPVPEKNVIKVPIPKMSKELRENLVKLAKTYAEKAKVGIRKTRQKGISDVKKKNDVSKDTVRRLEKHIQKLTDDHTLKVDEMLKAKTTELTKGV